MCHCVRSINKLGSLTVGDKMQQPATTPSYLPHQITSVLLFKSSSVLYPLIFSAYYTLYSWNKGLKIFYNWISHVSILSWLCVTWGMAVMHMSCEAQ